MTRAVFDLRHPLGESWAIFRAEHFVGFSFGHTATEALDLWCETPLADGAIPGRIWPGPWFGVREDEARERGLIK